MRYANISFLSYDGLSNAINRFLLSFCSKRKKSNQLPEFILQLSPSPKYHLTYEGMNEFLNFLKILTLHNDMELRSSCK